MKKYEVSLITKQGEKTVKVYIEDNIAKLLDECSEEVKQIYLIEEYKAKLNERKETRWHISLEKSIANGYEYESKTDLPLQEILKAEERESIEKLLKSLTDKQYKVLMLYVYKGWTFETIAKKMDISFQCAHQIYQAAIKKLKKINPTTLKKAGFKGV